MKERRLSSLKHKRITKYFSSCGINTTGELITELQGGFFHKVYKVASNEGHTAVRKTPRFPSVTRKQSEERNILLLQHYFGEYVNDSIVRSASQNARRFVVSSRFLPDRAIQSSDIIKDGKTITPLGKELGEIIKRNEAMRRETGFVLDMIGLKEILRAVRRSKPVVLGNIFVVQGVDGNLHLKIIDTDLGNTEDKGIPGKKEIVLMLAKIQENILRKHFAASFNFSLDGTYPKL